MLGVAGAAGIEAIRRFLAPLNRTSNPRSHPFIPSCAFLQLRLPQAWSSRAPLLPGYGAWTLTLALLRRLQGGASPKLFVKMSTLGRAVNP